MPRCACNCDGPRNAPIESKTPVNGSGMPPLRVPAHVIASYGAPPAAPNGYRGSPDVEPDASAAHPAAGLIPDVSSGAPYAFPEWKAKMGVNAHLSCL